VAHTRIKVCGITRPEDALSAISYGADAIGLVFYAPSPRAVTVEQAASIVAVVPPFVSVVALFVNETALRINEVLSSLSIDVLQFHGDESGEFCRQFDRPYIKAVRVQADLDLDTICRAHATARGVLLDAWQDGVPGGTGKTFDWRLAALQLPLPVVLAGGLSAGNVSEAIAALQPSAVDVSGGVELRPGVKDWVKIKQFISAVETADQR
jgi:phosphoribosylanthranilate isomerase